MWGNLFRRNAAATTETDMQNDMNVVSGGGRAALNSTHCQANSQSVRHKHTHAHTERVQANAKHKSKH